eukprot:scaffold225153_cov19-Tisochrysis_lutea.AAC.2
MAEQHRFSDSMLGEWSNSSSVLSAAGAVNHDELVKMATDAFGGVPDEVPSSSVREIIAQVRLPAQ